MSLLRVNQAREDMDTLRRSLQSGGGSHTPAGGGGGRRWVGKGRKIGRR